MLSVKYRPITLLTVALGLALTPPPVLGQGKAPDKPQQVAPGSLTGTITNAQKEPVSSAATLVRSGVMITAEEQQSAGGRDPDAAGRNPLLGTGESRARRAGSDVNLAGLYTLDKLRPGVYNLMVEAGKITSTAYRPQRIMGVVIRPGQQTTLDITLHEGTTLEEVGEPAISLARLHQYGWLEGTITNAEGLAIDSARSLLATGINITITQGGKTMGQLKTDHMAGGFFSVQNCIPGTYTFLIEAGERPSKKYRPQLISKVVVKPGLRTVLNIVMSEGAGLERIETPQVKMQPIKTLSE